MTYEQMDLTAPSKEKAAELAESLMSLLDSAEEWLTRKQLLHILCMPARSVRAARQAASGQVIYGQQGFKHIRHATTDEYLKCRGALRSQIRAMEQEVIELDKAWHKYEGSKFLTSTEDHQ